MEMATHFSWLIGFALTVLGFVFALGQFYATSKKSESKMDEILDSVHATDIKVSNIDVKVNIIQQQNEKMEQRISFLERNKKS